MARYINLLLLVLLITVAPLSLLVVMRPWSSDLLPSFLTPLPVLEKAQTMLDTTQKDVDVDDGPVEFMRHDVKFGNVRITPKKKKDSLIIFFHGLGTAGWDWVPMTERFRASLPHTEWLMPHAPGRHIGVSASMTSAWFNFKSWWTLLSPENNDEEGVYESIIAIEKIIQQEIDSGMPENRIIIGGFSMGGAIAIQTALETRRKLAGVIIFSGWIPLFNRTAEVITPEALQTPMFWGHGTADMAIGYPYGVNSTERMWELGMPNVTDGQTFARPGLVFHTYVGMGHVAQDQEYKDAEAWLVEALK